MPSDPSPVASNPAIFVALDRIDTARLRSCLQAHPPIIETKSTDALPHVATPIGCAGVIYKGETVVLAICSEIVLAPFVSASVIFASGAYMRWFSRCWSTWTPRHNMNDGQEYESDGDHSSARQAFKLLPRRLQQFPRLACTNVTLIGARQASMSEVVPSIAYVSPLVKDKTRYFTGALVALSSNDGISNLGSPTGT
ncbi:hypothetical protein C8F01DRAFT_1087683 [Mycena amicta]|nr:hypothetical protein C8F01DRAFT_1087683 [Mycena amicta]